MCVFCMCVVCVMYDIVHRYVYVACVLYVLCMTLYICTYVLCVCVFIIFLYYFFAFRDPLFEELGTLTDLKLLFSL